MIDPICYLDGKFIPLKDANVGVLDLGLLRGFGIYEGIAAFSGEPFHFHDHFERFVISAKALGLTLSVSENEARETLKQVVAHNSPGTRASVRMVLTGGRAEGGLEHVPGRETFFITADPTIPLPEALYEKGASLITYEHQRFLPEFKTTNYINAVMLQPKRKAAGAIEILYISQGTVLECATSNICIVKNGTVIAPKENILPGITRKVVLDLARSVYPVEERTATTDELFGADEVFVTSSFKDVVPVVSIDSRTIGSGKPGSITKDIGIRFTAYTKIH